MSGSGPPPPYFGHPPPPQPGFAYVPTPVYMPAYPHPHPHHPPPHHHHPDATYITNVYQQPTVVAEAPNVHPKEDNIDWIPATPFTAKELEYKAFVGGREGHDGSPLWIIRSRFNDEFVPGKLAIKHRSAYIPHNGIEVPVQSFEVLCANPGAVRWLPSSNGQVPVGAIPAGNTATGEPLYVARTPHHGSITPGKVHPSHGCCYISFGGMEIPYKSYEVLCHVV